jgi:hypothetical protein
MEQNWELSQKRYDAFWQNEAVDRCLLYLTTTKGEWEPEPDDYYEKWMDIPARIDRHCSWIGRTTFLADAFPSAFINFGPGALSACIGGGFEPAANTIWFDRDPILTDWDLSKIGFQPEGEMWRAITEMTDQYLARNKAVVSVSDLGGTLDILASLRGSETLLYDLFDEPEKVKQAVELIEPLWEQAYDMSVNKLLKAQGAMTSWMPIWCRDRYYPLQCDFCAMISPAMFGEFVLPNLRRQTEFLDHAIYHLDGPGEVPHLDQLLSLPRLTAIQWTAGAGNANVIDPQWIEMYQKILGAGKGLVLLEADLSNPERLEYLLSKIPTRGLYICGDCTTEQAEECVRIANAAGVK